MSAMLLAVLGLCILECSSFLRTLELTRFKIFRHTPSPFDLGNDSLVPFAFTACRPGPERAVTHVD